MPFGEYAPVAMTYSFEACATVTVCDRTVVLWQLLVNTNPPTTVAPPLRPAGPCAPVAPVAPSAPFVPFVPFAPAAPAAPVPPFAPGEPAGPDGPAAPVSPFGPGAPAMFQVRDVSPCLQFVTDASMTRTAPPDRE